MNIRKIIFIVLLPVHLLTGNSFRAQSSWTTWTKHSGNPVYSHSTGGAWDVASDPSVIKENATSYRMIVSGDGGTSSGSVDGNSILMATSVNGISWTTIPNGKNGVVLTSNKGDWDESMELPELIKVGKKWLVFYSGYDPAVRDSSGGLIWGDLGRAASTDGSTFTKTSTPVMTRTPNSYDQNGITDATIVQSHDTLYMIYVGWCTKNCALNGGAPAFYSLKAISLDSGMTWTKKGLLDPSGIVGLQHPDLVLDADGKYSLFYGVDNSCSSTAIGIHQSVSAKPFGPFIPVTNNPIFCMGTQSFEHAGTDGGFPSVINDNGIGRMWYTGVDENNFIYKIGLVESNNVSTAITETLAVDNSIEVYPNPTIDNLTVTLAGNTNDETAFIFNYIGEVIKVIQIEQSGQINISGFSNGIYFIGLMSQPDQKFKFIKY